MPARYGSMPAAMTLKGVDRAPVAAAYLVAMPRVIAPDLADGANRSRVTIAAAGATHPFWDGYELYISHSQSLSRSSGLNKGRLWVRLPTATSGPIQSRPDFPLARGVKRVGSDTLGAFCFFKRYAITASTVYLSAESNPHCAYTARTNCPRQFSSHAKVHSCTSRGKFPELAFPTLHKM
jgi:hypothetical protein